jgi:DNA polymerase III subunit delta'
MIDAFQGNRSVVEALDRMIEAQRIAQTLLLDGPEGVGKATLVRRFAARLIAGAQKIEQDDLSLAHNVDIIEEREKWPSEKRVDDPLFFSSHPDFITFPPDGPLRQISIQQMRLLKERAQYKPLKGAWRVFLIDHVDRAGEQAANSLLKTLEEPPEHLILVMTAENPYDLLPTIRSRAVPFHMVRLTEDEMRSFATSRGLDHAERRLALAAGSPGVALALDLEDYDKRRAAMLALLAAACGEAGFGVWVKHAESIAARKSEKLELYLKVLYLLLGDILALQYGRDELRNPDIRPALQALAARARFEWIRKAVAKVDELMDLLRRNIQKSIALDALVVELRSM